MAFDVLVTCNEGKRDYAIERLKEFQDIKNIQQRKDQNQILAQVQSEDRNYVITNVVQRIEAIDGISNASLLPLA